MSTVLTTALPDDLRFAALKEKPHFALDIGGTLCKVAYTTFDHNPNYESGKLQILLNFAKFTNIEECIDFLKREWKDRSSESVIHCTGGGAYKYFSLLEEQLCIIVHRVDEMQSLVAGFAYLLNFERDEAFAHHHEKQQAKNISQCQTFSSTPMYPLLLVNIGTGVSILKIQSETSFERVGGTALGAGTFVGLGGLITGAKSSAIEFYSDANHKAYFIKHDGYTGVLGSFMQAFPPNKGDY